MQTKSFTCLVNLFQTDLKFTPLQWQNRFFVVFPIRTAFTNNDLWSNSLPLYFVFRYILLNVSLVNYLTFSFIRAREVLSSYSDWRSTKDLAADPITATSHYLLHLSLVKTKHNLNNFINVFIIPWKPSNPITSKTT